MPKAPPLRSPATWSDGCWGGPSEHGRPAGGSQGPHGQAQAQETTYTASRRRSDGPRATSPRPSTRPSGPSTSPAPRNIPGSRPAVWHQPRRRVAFPDPAIFNALAGSARRHRPGLHGGASSRAARSRCLLLACFLIHVDMRLQDGEERPKPMILMMPKTPDPNAQLFFRRRMAGVGDGIW